MNREGRDWIAIALATAGVVGAISLAGIFIVYLVDTIGGDDGGKPAASQVSGTTAGPTAATGPAAGSGSSGPKSTSGSTNGAGGATAAAGPTVAQNRISDHQVYSTLKNRAVGYSILVPKGWQKRGKDANIEYRFIANVVHIRASQGKQPTVESVGAKIAANKKLTSVKAPRETTVGTNHAVVVTVRNLKKKLIDQYWFGKDKKVVVLELATIDGAAKDNADDFRRIASSFRWL